MTRKAASAAVLGGLSYIVVNLAIETAFPDHWAGSPDQLLGWDYADWSRVLWIPSVLLLMGFIATYRRLRPGLGGLGAAGFYLTAAGFVLDILGLVIEFWIFGLLLVPWVGEFTTGSAGSNLGYDINGLGSLLHMIGLMVFAAACLRTALPMRWRILLVLLALSMLSSLYFYLSNRIAIHIVLHGTLWIVAGWLLLWEVSTTPRLEKVPG